MRVDKQYLNKCTQILKRNDWPKSKWIIFCEVMIDLGFVVKVYRARKTKSKYCTVTRAGDHRKFKVRFSDHKPIRSRELNGDCDFFVGVTHTGVRTTQCAINAVCKHFGIDRNNPNVEYIEDFR
jgi:hypothetical protein